MRILLASEYFYPKTKGGTEMYVFQLAKELLEHGHDCAVLSLSNTETYGEFNGVNIFYIPFITDASQESESPSNYNALLVCVSNFKPDVFHLHTLTPSLGINHLEKLKSLSIHTVFTTHITSFSCLRGDLMLFGKEICDGKLDRNRCMNCFLHKQGFTNPVVSNFLTALSSYSLLKSLYTPLKVYDNKFNAMEKFKKYLDHIMVVCQWQKSILMNNGFADSKTSICRQAVNKKDILDNKVNALTDSVKIGFIGRIVRIKGLDFLMNTLKEINSTNVTLHIAGIKSNDEVEYYNEMKAIAKEEKYFWNENLDSSGVLNFLDNIDLLVVPSFWIETGPYVIFEALARKVPVLTFNLGGATELINNNKNGWLVDSAEELKNKLSQIIMNPQLLKEASDQIQDVRNTNDMYNEMLSVYQSLKK